ncbi:3-ketoacyl-CoA synthase 6 [Tetrabaena socialis]|uniref:3-ketoacyl-CoA synthase n=1 Tax=Tetrabaena socialis TaxID=47790 RepID=A0A2J7ZXZ0_9CHLO|nr:3-ketoacyl-CoA synthase 6 [Tetrabaena socialis]|eukprot:PNH05133.1 3-ketoacyl-CoA synthase 6 [Tetrabaena socialis]
MATSNPVYLLDSYVYKPPEELVVSFHDVDEAWNAKRREQGSIFAKSNGSIEDAAKADAETQDIVDFMERVWRKSGLSDHATYLPKSIHPKFCGNHPRTDMDAAAEECRMAVCGAVEGLLKKTGLAARDIDILVTTCSIYCPTPSVASMVVNAFGLRKDCQAYHLGGMGCANGVVAVNLVADMLKAHPNSNALFVTNETTTPAFYKGRDKHRLVTNVLFRMGAAAVLLTNKPSLRAKAKYRLLHRFRVHLGASDDAYKCIWYGPDSEGLNGIYLGMDVVKEASKGLTLAMMKIGRHILNWDQIAAWLWNRVEIKVLRKKGVQPYTPSFAECVQHFLIHAGGAKVLDGIGRNLGIGESHLWPSRAVLRYFGNVSSSTTWYTLAAVESLRGVRKGDKVLQIGVGSGIKCGVNVWKALRDVEDVHDAWRARAEAGDRTRLADVSHWRLHVGARLLSFALLALLAALLWRLVLLVPPRLLKQQH